MAKIKIKGLGKAFKNIQKQFDRFLEDPNEQTKTSKIIRNELISNLREGKGSDDKPLPSLSNSWVNRRQKLAQFNKTASKYSPRKSNITFTGKFVRSLKVISAKASRFFGFKSISVFEIEYTGSKKSYKTKKNREKRRTVQHSDIFRGLTKRNWKLAGVTKDARIRIAKQFKRYIRRRRRR